MVVGIAQPVVQVGTLGLPHPNLPAQRVQGEAGRHGDLVVAARHLQAVNGAVAVQRPVLQPAALEEIALLLLKLVNAEHKAEGVLDPLGRVDPLLRRGSGTKNAHGRSPFRD
jgi:hypothetical protein